MGVARNLWAQEIFLGVYIFIRNRGRRFNNESAVLDNFSFKISYQTLFVSCFFFIFERHRYTISSQYVRSEGEIAFTTEFYHTYLCLMGRNT